MLSVFLLSVNYAECHKQAHYAQCRYAECRYAECIQAECRRALSPLSNIYEQVWNQGILKGKYHCTIDLLFDWLGISCMTTDIFCFYLQNRLIQTSQTGCQWYSDTSPFSIPCWNAPKCCHLSDSTLSVHIYVNIKLGLKCEVVKNALVYYVAIFIVILKVQTP